MTTTALITHNGISFTSTGLQVTRPDTPLSDWLESGLKFRHYINSVNALEALLWGDWLNWGKAQYGEDFKQGYQIVIPPDDPRSNYTDKTIWQYMYTAAHVPVDVWGLPGLSHRHYFDAVTRIKNEDGIRAHLLRVSQEQMSAREAYKTLPASSRPQRPARTQDDAVFELIETNLKLEQELAHQRAELAQVASIASQAVKMLNGVTLPETQQVKNVLETIKAPLLGDLPTLAYRVVKLSRQNLIGEMYDAIEEMGQLLEGSARAETISVNGRVLDRGEFLG